MKRISLWILCITLVSQISYTQDISKAKSLLVPQMENDKAAELITKHSALFPDQTQLSIALIDGEETSYIGIKRADGVLNTTDNKEGIFEIGSISKVFTSVLLSNFVHSNQISVDDKLSSFITLPSENAPEGSEDITLEMLANHTSGLPRLPMNMYSLMAVNQNNPYKEYTPELLEEFFKNEMALVNKPNSMSAYSNLGVGTLGYILTKKAKMSYEELLQKFIFEPLEMKHSSSIGSQIDQEKLINGLNPDGTKAENWDFTDALVGCGGIKSNAVDMVKFIRKNFEDDEVYNLPQQSTFTIAEGVDMGLSWVISENENVLIWHNGGTGGYRSCMVLDKKNKKAVLVLSNVSGLGNQSANIDNLCFDLIKML